MYYYVVVWYKCYSCFAIKKTPIIRLRDLAGRTWLMAKQIRSHNSNARNGIVLSGHAKVVEVDTYNQKGKSQFIPLFIYSYSTVIFHYISLILIL